MSTQFQAYLIVTCVLSWAYEEKHFKTEKKHSFIRNVHLSFKLQNETK